MMRPQIPPQPRIQSALLTIEDAKKSLERASAAWNRSQVEDAIRSARFFIDIAEKEINSP